MESVPQRYPPGTLQIHSKFSNEFSWNFPGGGNVRYIHSVPSHVTRVFLWGKPWEHLKFPKGSTWGVPEWLIHDSVKDVPTGVIKVFQISKT